MDPRKDSAHVCVPWIQDSGQIAARASNYDRYRFCGYSHVIPKKFTFIYCGDHPWEIKRGGNTTHINLWVHHCQYGKPGYEIGLTGQSFTRLTETICMFLALQAAGKPITIDDPEGVRKRLLAEDNKL